MVFIIMTTTTTSTTSFLSVTLLSILFVVSFANRETRTCIDADALPHKSTRLLDAELERLTRTSTFFSIFRVALDKKCPFWDDNGQCTIQDCSVCNCAPHEVPTAWRVPLPGKEECKGRAPAPGNVDRSLPTFLMRQKKLRGWAPDPLVWTEKDSDTEAQFVDLRKNPEAYTAYTGTHANSIWGAVYNENCFEIAPNCRSGVCEPGTCKEERVFYRLISGVHTSITAHLAKVYRFPDGKWGENSKIYAERIASHPERIKNLNVALAIVVRAVAKAAKDISPENYDYITGDDKNDKVTKNQLSRVLSSPLLDPECQRPAFDESDMFVSDSRHRLPQFREKFHNISRIMNCVGCEKCRLWGKLQFLGVGTALRILFEEKVPKLQRNEVIALINLLHKLTTSVLWCDKMEAKMSTKRKPYVTLNLAFGAAIGAFLFGATAFLRSSKNLKRKEKEKSENTNTNADTSEANKCARGNDEKKKER